METTNQNNGPETFISNVMEVVDARSLIEEMTVTPQKGHIPEGVNLVGAQVTSTEIRDLVMDAPECLRQRKAYRERGHVLACMGGMEVGAHESSTVILGEMKIDIAVLRDTRNGLPVGAVVRQVTGEYGTLELWSPLFLERTRGKTVGAAQAYRAYYQNLSDPDFVASELIALYGRQTEDEQKYKDTVHLNGKGFCAFSGKAGTKLAEKVLARKDLNEKDMAKATAILLRHRRQAITS